MITLKCKVTYISNIEQIRRSQKPDLFKIVLDFITEDGQVFYGELRNNNCKVIEREGISVDSIVKVEIELQGSEKGDKKYNNILINNIKLIKQNG